jgi:Ca2+-binding RTX toxin-like protein
MPVFEVLTNIEHRVHRWDSFRDYTLEQDSGSSWRLVYDSASRGPLDETRQPAEVRITISGGEITALSYHNSAGVPLARMTDLSFDADFFESFFLTDNASGIFGTMISGGAEFIGGNQAEDSDANDDITTGTGDDTIRARDGNDYLKDFGGSDTYNGGNGRDEVTYDEWFWRSPEFLRQGIVADLAAGTVVGPDGETDTLISIERVKGTFAADTFLGDNTDFNQFAGMQGADSMNGRGGFDFLWYGSDQFQGGTGRITVNLKKGFAVDGFGDRDRFKNIEGASGGVGNDKLIDNKKDNYFDGREGNDTIILSLGDDEARGNAGADRFVFKGTAIGEDHVTDFNPGDGDRLVWKAVGSRSDLTITVENGDTTIRLNADAAIVLDDYTGPVDAFLSI